eukprot:CAMPEP_0179473448 /NCGR_PEP_ID=MMETSP0799-20121207/53181_1 /TAXON_ID=46947 /ORGANISM="Geminigera cryophila, Strain CCMP2564" /LENGTH=134 /DNA_ID=CAMNT_0021282075 /DNA_START=608 /DNA_END=1012 /DNA_ORIENTATION=-
MAASDCKANNAIFSRLPVESGADSSSWATPSSSSSSSSSYSEVRAESSAEGDGERMDKLASTPTADSPASISICSSFEIAPVQTASSAAPTMAESLSDSSDGPKGSGDSRRLAGRSYTNMSVPSCVAFLSWWLD